jgi:hypothetical protein
MATACEHDLFGAEATLPSMVPIPTRCAQLRFEFEAQMARLEMA